MRNYVMGYSEIPIEEVIENQKENNTESKETNGTKIKQEQMVTIRTEIKNEQKEMNADILKSGVVRKNKKVIIVGRV